MTALFTLSFPPESPLETVPLVQLAEHLGYSGVWIPDSQLLWREPFTSLAYYVSKTNRIGLGFAVTNIVTRHVSVLASAAATLNEMSGGRVVLGIGSGATGVGVAGLRRATLAQLEKSVTIVRQLLSGESVPTGSQTLSSDKGHEYLPEDEMRLHWKPGTPPPPIFLSAHGPRALRLAGKIADGVVYSLGALPEMVRFANERISEGVNERGKDNPSKVQRWSRVALAIGEKEDKKAILNEVRPYVATVETNLAFLGSAVDIPSSLRDEALQTLKKYDISEHVQTNAEHARLISDNAVEQLAIVGTPPECVERIAELQKSGAANFNFVIFTAKDKKRLMERFASEVMPHVR